MTPPVHSARIGWNAQPVPKPRPAASVSQRRRWWQWPHLLSLDAPAVAVIWLWWWASGQNVRLPFDRYAILGLCVWAIYVADRVADASKMDAPEAETDRHHFHAVYRRNLVIALAVTLAGLVVLVLMRLPRGQFFGGLSLLGLVALYYWIIHHVSRTFRPWVPKEAAVGGIFALGTSFFLIGAGGTSAGAMSLQVMLFGVLCFLNCAFITAWERRTGDLQDEASLLRAFPRTAANLPSAALGLVGVSIAAAFALGGTGPLPVALSAGALWALDQRRNPVGPERLRVLADVVLMTPLLVAAVF